MNNDLIVAIMRFLKTSTHGEHCAAISAQSDNCCTCGRTNAILALESLEIESDETDGLMDALNKVQEDIHALIDSEEYKTIKRDEVKMRLEKIIDY